MKKLDTEMGGNKQAEMNLYEDVIRQALLNHATSSSGLAIGTTDNKTIRIASTTTYLNNGAFLSRTAIETPFTAGGAMDIAASPTTVQERAYLVSLDAAGAVTITPGLVTTGLNTCIVPDIVAGLTPVGYVKISVAAASAGFVAGTTALNAAGLTVAYTSVGYLLPSFKVAV